MASCRILGVYHVVESSMAAEQRSVVFFVWMFEGGVLFYGWRGGGSTRYISQTNMRVAHATMVINKIGGKRGDHLDGSGHGTL
jgi:hypothetical protein